MNNATGKTELSNARRSGSFVQQAAILVAASMAVRVLGFIYRTFLTNIIGNEGNAIYGAGFNFYNFFLILSSSGMPGAISKLVSERQTLKQYANAHRIFKMAMLLSGGLGLLFSFVMALGAKQISSFIGMEESYFTLITLSPTIFIVAIMAVFRGYFQGMNTTVPTAISQVIEQVFNAIFSVLLVHLLFNKGLEYAAAGGTAGTGIGAFAGLLFIVFAYLLVKPKITRRVKASRKMSPERNKDIVKLIAVTTVPMIIGTAIFSITNLADMAMVMNLLPSDVFSDEAAKELYGQLTGKYVTLTTLPISIATSMATAVVPNIAASFIAKDTAIVKKKVNLALRITMIITIPAAVGLGVLSHQIMLLLFPKTPDGGDLLMIGAIAVVFLSLTQICTGVLQGTGKVHVPAINAAIGAIVKVALNFLLIPIPSINVIGAVISTIGCYVVAGGLNFAYLLKHTKIKADYASIFVKPAMSACVMGMGCYVGYFTCFYLTNVNALSTLFAIVFAVVLYVAFMLLIKGIEREDVLLLPGGEKVALWLDGMNLL